MELSQKMDKEKQHIDTKFIDQSWDNMSDLLDKEMPVQKRKRRFFWMWFLGLVAILMVGFAYQFHLALNQPIVPKTQTDKVAKVAKVEMPTINIATELKDKKTTPTKKISKHKQFPQKSNNEKYKPGTSKSLLVGKASNISKEVKAPTDQHSNPLLLENKGKVEPLKENSNAQILSTKIEYNYQKWLNHNIPLLPLPTFPLFQKEQSIKILPIVNPVSKKSIKWRFGFYAGGLNNKLGSFRAGIHSNLVLNPNWTLHVGLGYSKRNKTNPFSNNGEDNADIAVSNDQEASQTDNEIPPPPLDPAAASGTLGTGLGAPQVDQFINFNYTKIHYFELPILFQYQLSPKWSIDFGGQIGYLHGVRYEQAGESNFTTDNAAFSAYNTRTQDSNSGIINDFNFAAIGGFSYKISSKVSAYSNYHLSNNYLTQTTTNSIEAKRWQQIEVGIRYYIK